nr:hypothetical protein LR48_Vigan11g128000 [Ipomoea trifida]
MYHEHDWGGKLQEKDITPCLLSQIYSRHKRGIRIIERSFIHFVEEDGGFAGLGGRNEVFLDDLENVIADFGELVFNLLAVGSDELDVVLVPLRFLFLLDRGHDPPRRPPRAYHVLIPNRQQIPLLNRQFHVQFRYLLHSLHHFWRSNRNSTEMEMNVFLRFFFLVRKGYGRRKRKMSAGNGSCFEMKFPIIAGSPLSSANWTWLPEDSYAATQRGINFSESFAVEVTESKVLEEEEPNKAISTQMLTISKSIQLSGGLGPKTRDSFLNRGLLMSKFCKPL